MPNAEYVSAMRPNQVYLALAGLFFLFFSIFLGLIAVFIPYQIAIAFIGVPVGLILAWLYPWFGLVILLALIGGLLPAHYLPQLPLFGGRVHAEDLLFSYLFLVIVFKQWNKNQNWWVSFKPYFLPLLLLVILAFVSVGCSFLIFNNSPKDILGELRHLIYWALLPLMMLALDSEDKLRWFVRAILVLSVLLALGLVSESVFGVSLLTGGRVEQIETLGVYGQAIRSTSPGIFIIIFGILLLSSRYLWAMRNSLAGLPWLVILGAGLIVTYGRSLWLASAIGFLFLLYLSRGRRAIRFTIYALSAVSLLALAIGFGKPEMLNAVLERVTSYKEEVVRGQSLSWRFEENQIAINKIIQSPLIGIGLGGQYKTDIRPEFYEGEFRYIHNGYLYLMLKLGVFALIPLIWIYWVAYKQGRRQLLATTEPWIQAIIGASMAVLLLPLLTAFTRPEWMQQGSIATYATLLGLLGAATALQANKQNIKPTHP